jgi:tetratricopeptide (TPR) repeat protein
MYKPYMSKNDNYYAKFVAQTFNLRGVCYEAKGNFEQALDDYWKAINWGNDDAYANKDKLEKTIDEKRAKAKEAKANNEDFSSGDQLLDEGNYDRAIIQYTKTIRAGGSNKAVALMNRAACYAKKGDKDQAIDDYTAAINSGLTGSDLATAKAELAKLK